MQSPCFLHVCSDNSAVNFTTRGPGGRTQSVCRDKYYLRPFDKSTFDTAYPICEQ